ncbi:MAG: asparaginase [Gemmatimonadetes bacterium]|jgi:L-asparaginase|nr:asparaginase [Gemmatimonadota bacterium]
MGRSASNAAPVVAGEVRRGTSGAVRAAHRPAGLPTRRAALVPVMAFLALSPTLVGAQPGVTRVPPRVHVLATGGTISNLGDDARRTGTELVGGIPGIGEMATVTVEQFSNVASSSVTQAMWRALAGRIRQLQRDANAPAGYVITHGTDTMEETAYFLSLTVGGCEPVIVTGAMRQANAVGADGPANLRNSIRTAVAPAARGRGTMVLMNDELFAARDVTKSNTTRLNAFTAPDAGVLGLADPDTVVFHRPAPACAAPRYDLDSLGEFPRVDVVYAYIGADSVAVDALVDAGARGLVLAGVGRGGTTPAMSRALRRATQRGVTVVISNRTGSGRVGAGSAPDSLATLPSGRGATIGATDLNPQKARVLLMLALAARTDARGIAELFNAR